MSGDRARTVRAADRVLDLLLCLGTADELSLGRIAAHTGLSKSTAHRLLESLEQVGLAEYRPATRTYGLGLRVLQLASRRSRATSLATLALPLLRRLRDETGETACLQVRSGLYRVCLEQVESLHDVRRFFPIGEPLAIYAGAIGKALMAFLPAADVDAILATTGLARITDTTITDEATMRRELACIRERGWATSIGERVAEASSVAGPVFGPTEEVVAAVGVSGPRWRFTPERAVGTAPEVVRAARQLSGLLGAPERQGGRGHP